MDKDLAKNKIQSLIAKYEKAKTSGLLSKYSEEETKKDFILPLFEVLGWEVFEKNEVSAEESQSSGRVDYGFYLGGRVKFYVEAKPLKADIHREDYANQAVKYSWNKGVTWAILTDFESLLVFNAQDIESSLSNKLFFEIPYSKYLERFDQLWLLSKDAFLQYLLDQEADRVGKKLQKVSVSALLYKDLDKCREILTHTLSQWNKDVDKDLIDEGVQKLLDRLIFLRVAEDRHIEPPTLTPLVRAWDSKGGKVHLYQSMVQKFREFDEIYNSNLFSPHPFEEWEEYSNATTKVIDILYGKKGYYEYDFQAMPADVLGTVYENYLGYRLEKSKKGLSISKDAKKRKEHGIYYTPGYIVDYIVQNTLKPILDTCNSIESLKKIKVLDPACGSGSFLIRAMQVIYEKYLEFGNPGGVFTKIDILLNNIYGVDLDPQAVEIARLNLLISALDTRMKLPGLDKNIKNGNSLISGSDEELKKYFGNNFRGKIPFNWEEEFPEVFKQGGFNIVIGNPPYVRNRDLSENDKDYFVKSYFSANGQYDLYQLFFERAVSILKDGGILGFITSNKYAIASYGKKLREYILDNSRILSIVDVSNIEVFKDASTYPYILLLKKDKENAGNQIKCYRVTNEEEIGEATEIIINQDSIKGSSGQNFILKNVPDFFGRIEKNSVRLGEIVSIKETIHTGNIRNKLVVDDRLDDNCKKLLAGKDCHRYNFQWNGKYLRYDKNLIDKSNGEYANLVEEKYFDRPKILLREIASNIECCYDDKGYYTLNKVYSVQALGKYNLKYLLSLLNSRLLSFYFRHKFEEAHVRGGYLQFKKIYTSQIPIHGVDFSIGKEKEDYSNLVNLADKMLDLNNQKSEATENSTEWEHIMSEINRTDKRVDELVYKLYGLTTDEVEIVEKSS